VSYDRQSRRSTRREDDWVPPPWNPASDLGGRDGSSLQGDHDSKSAQRVASRKEPAQHPHESGHVLGLAIAPATVGLLALIASALPFLSAGDSVPRGLMLIVLIQLFVAAVLHAAEHTALMRSWIATVITSAVLVPLLALQVTLLREPYVSWSRGSASPSLVATLVVSMVLLAGAVWSVAVSWAEPDVAGLLFMPQAMVVPAMVGMRSTIKEQPALEMLGKIMLLAAAATAISWVFPPATRILTPPFAVAVEFVLLWATGYGPWFHETSGDIVRVLYSVMLALAVILVVAVPFVALWVKQGATAITALGRRSTCSGRRTTAARGPVVPR